MTLQVGYPYDRRSLEPRPLKAREIWSIAEQVRQQFLRPRPRHRLDLDRLVRAARRILVNGIEIVAHWDLDRSVRDGKGREALGVTEADPALPGVLLISLNADLIAGRDYLKRSTLAHELGHALFDGPSMLRQAGQPAFAMVTPDEEHLVKPTRGRGGMDWREVPRQRVHGRSVGATCAITSRVGSPGDCAQPAAARRGRGSTRAL